MRAETSANIVPALVEDPEGKRMAQEQSPGSGPAVIFGGAGFIGSHLARSLQQEGREVVVADLAPERDSAGVTARYVDVRKPIDLDVGRPGVVYNLAAVHRTPGHPDHEYYDTNVQGALHITRWCEEVNAEAIVFTSSISVYGPSAKRLDETSPLRPNSAYGRSKLLAEEVHKTWLRQAPERKLVIVRPAVVFGPGERGNFTRLAKALERGRFLYPGSRTTIKGCGYVGDLVRAMPFALERADPSMTINYCYPRPYTVQDICETFARVAGYGLPRGLPRSALRATEAVLGGFPVTSDLAARMQKLRFTTDVEPRALVDEGFVWETDLERALLAWRDSEPVGRFE